MVSDFDSHAGGAEHPHQADRAFLTELATRVELGGSTGEHSTKPILDSGRHGLEFFERFGPAYARLTGADFDFERDFARRYEQDGDLVLGSLRADRDRYAAIERGLDDSVHNLRNRGNAVFESWQGGAADSVAGRFSGLLSAAEDLRGQFAALGQTIDSTAETMDRACFRKADRVSRLYADRVDGRTSDDVGFLVDFVARAAAARVSDDDLARATTLFDSPVTPAAYRAQPGGIDALASTVDKWLRGTFLPHYQQRAEEFEEICADTEESLSAAWQELGTALDAVRADQFDTVIAGLAEPAPASPAAPRAEPENRATAHATTGAAPEQAPARGQAAGGTATGGGIGVTPDPNQTTPQPSPPASGPQAGRMISAGAGPMPAVPIPPPPVAPAAPVSGGTGAGGGFFGLPFLGGAGAGGGGDQDRQRLGLPLAGTDFGDFQQEAAQSGTAIGGEDDPARYNEEAHAEAERAGADTPAVDDFGDLDDDLW